MNTWSSVGMPASVRCFIFILLGGIGDIPPLVPLRQLGVDLGSEKRSVTKQLLNLSYISAVVQQVSRIRMTNHVGCYEPTLARQAAIWTAFLQHASNRTLFERTVGLILVLPFE